METKLFDLDKFGLSDRNGMYLGQAGAKEGIDVFGQNWIVKYPKTTKGMAGDLISYMTSPLSEYIGSHIYDILGYAVHQTVLGIRNEKLVVACRDFCEDGATLREIRALKNIYNRELEEQIEKSLSSTGSEHSVDLEEMLIHMDYNPVLSQVPGGKKRFWDCVLIDGLINNNDRNNGNWGLLYKNGGYSLAPIYDNGAAFSNKMPEEKVTSMIADPQKLRASSLNTISSYSLNGKILLYKDIVRLDNADLKQSLYRVVPNIREKLGEINRFIDNIPESDHGFQVCSEQRKIFYKAGMEARLEEILTPALENAMDKLPGQMDRRSCI